EDLEQQFGRRSPLREAVDPLGQFAIALPGGVVRHGNSIGRIGQDEKRRHHRSLFFLIYAMPFRRTPSRSFSDSELDFTLYLMMIRLRSDRITGNSICPAATPDL